MASGRPLRADLVAVCICFSLSTSLLRPAQAFIAPEEAGGVVSQSAAPKPAPLLDFSRLTPVNLPAPVPLSSDAPAVVAEAVASAAGLATAGHLRFVKQETDDLGTKHYRFDQVEPYTGGAARVYGGDVIAHVDPTGVLVGVSGNVALGITAALPPTVGKASARRNQLGHVRGKAPAFAGAGLRGTELLVIPGASTDVVAWCSSADLTGDVDAAGQARPSQLRVCSAAHGSGQVVESRDELRTLTGTGNSFFSGQVVIDTIAVSVYNKQTKKYTTQYQMQADSTGNGKTLNMNGGTNGGSVFADADNTWGSSTLSDTATVGVDAHWGSMKTFEYYLRVHNRNGLRNDGRAPPSRVHYSRAYNNAFWDGTQMTYGDGDGVTFNPFTALDVTGHEMTHGVTEVTANLIYSGESGGLNEATSDILGTMVEFYAANTRDTPDYLIGEMLYKAGNTALRYMYKPSLDGKSPDCYSSSVGSLNVHYSSGPANHFYYLLAEGSAPAIPMPASPTCDGSVVVGIGRAKAEKIWYRALTSYMVSSTNYAGARTATLNASNSLYGAGSMESQTVAKAWTAVGVN